MKWLLKRQSELDQSEYGTSTVVIRILHLKVVLFDLCFKFWFILYEAV